MNQKQLDSIIPLVKATTTLVQLWTLYLFATWGYQLLMWVANTLKEFFI